MSLMNSSILRMVMGSKDGEQTPTTSNFDKWKENSPDNPFGQSSSDAYVNSLLQGGQKPQYSLSGFSQDYFAGQGNNNGMVPLSSLNGIQQQPQQQRFSLNGGNDYTWLRGLR